MLTSDDDDLVLARSVGRRADRELARQEQSAAKAISGGVMLTGPACLAQSFVFWECSRSCRHRLWGLLVVCSRRSGDVLERTTWWRSGMNLMVERGCAEVI